MNLLKELRDYLKTDSTLPEIYLYDFPNQTFEGLVLTEKFSTAQGQGIGGQLSYSTRNVQVYLYSGNLKKSNELIHNLFQKFFNLSRISDSIFNVRTSPPILVTEMDNGVFVWILELSLNYKNK